MAPTVPTDEQTFLIDVSAGTGIDPRVLQVEQTLEGHPGDEPGYYNWFNIPTSTATFNQSPVVGTGPGGTAAFGSLAAGVQATITEEERIGLAHEKGKSIAQQISDIQHSGWASSGYPDFVSQFESLYPGVSLGTRATQATPSPGQAKGGGATGPAFGGFPGGGALQDLIDAAKGPLKQILQLVQLYYLRVLEVIGGALLVLVSLFMLTRGSLPSPL